VKFAAIEKVTYLDRLTVAHRAKVREQRMLIQVRLESR